MTGSAPSRARTKAPGARLAALALAASLVSLAAPGCRQHETPTAADPQQGAKAPASPPAATTTPAPDGQDSVRIDRDPDPARPPAPPAASAPAPGTLSLRFIVRAKETETELPAGSFDVRLLSLDAIREGKGDAAGAAPAAPAQGEAAYKGGPEQILVTQPDGTKQTFIAGLRPGVYALRITAKGRRMLLEVLTVKPEDKLVQRTLDRE